MGYLLAVLMLVQIKFHCLQNGFTMTHLFDYVYVVSSFDSAKLYVC